VVKKQKIKIGRLFKFESAHKLPGEKIYGKCSNLHGHSYSLEVEISGYVNEKGWVCNFSEIKDFVNELIINRYDHHNLNDFIDLPTAENILLQIYNDLRAAFKNKKYKLSRLKLWENEKSYAEIECE
jgi:6-pyruvoyltetrahydropterin/6-carboxytetrahydropterin synthase